MSIKKIPVLKIEELEKLNTKQLLSILKKLQSCENSFEETDLTYDINLDPTKYSPNLIFYKETDSWKQAYIDVKNILKTREHIIKGLELKKLRLEKVKINQTKDKSYSRKNSRKFFL